MSLVFFFALFGSLVSHAAKYSVRAVQIVRDVSQFNVEIDLSIYKVSLMGQA